MKMADNASFSILKEKQGIAYMGTAIVGQFEIKEISSNTSRTTNDASFTFTIKMRRDYKQHIVCIFLPTFLLWLLAYSSLLIQIDDFSDRFMGSVTALLVFTAFLGPIYDQLPETSYIKFIDIWVMWYMTNMFLICIFHVILDRSFNARECNHEERNPTIDQVELFNTGSNISQFNQQEVNNHTNSGNANQERDKTVIINGLAVQMFPVANLLFNIFYFLFSSR